MNPQDIINHLDLQPHPEGGWFKETWRADNPGRATGTCIYFLLTEGQSSHWHKVDATEIWLYHSGAPLTLSISATDAGPAIAYTLTPDLANGAPQLIVPKGHWQAARSTGAYTLVSCTVSPGFEFEGFELAGPDFDIPAK
ncbi:cupin domain-containing protein [Ruegeria conchae]|uniref:cupin domain-containing protein n=1 Tax=Ruegeria conchae TaxID=981384 RepID=UPI00147FF09D|nr:cupin domain-containing protein [Ruegeria conchae]UWR01407.1 cupin domain-containing protein [Ruegeria conchae]